MPTRKKHEEKEEKIAKSNRAYSLTGEKGERKYVNIVIYRYSWVTSLLHK